ncbi:xanthine dehydrogenase family protein molybdopterin-binding subunit [Novosphingobium profundi]|uniref:xanthine dehydrogenase family protein molybdopterin-binding subunit n=1 Tax=Novosphingobium profundi TaxID=1774954 RepID=UPI001BD9D788|nr:molybdopterin cofactor-binding domain-containing protein [Novosphingobium profundi]MBT0671389.1 xanthine dehydrogenase family protein molybdopterin-binding subunit [Novosphingobium profundi]
MAREQGVLNLSRRGVVGGLSLGAGLFVLGMPMVQAAEPAAGHPESARFGAMLSIDAASRVRLIVPSTEMGQGTQEALARFVAEELDCDWAALEVELPWADQSFANPLARKQITANSMTVMGYYTSLRKLGAASRAMLVAAAAARLGVPAESLTVHGGVIRDPASDRTLSFGDVAQAASSLPVPQALTLKPASAFTIIGGKSPRKDLRPKVMGQAEFGIDVHEEGMLIGVPVLAPHPKASFEAKGLEAAKARPGIHAIVPVSGGLVVIADRYWRAKSAADTITLTVTASPLDKLDDKGIHDRLAAAFDEVAPKPFPQFDMNAFPPRIVPEVSGAFEAAFEEAARVIEAEYQVPHLAHATLEPICCSARFDEQGLLVRGPLQDPDNSHRTAAKLSGLPMDKVRVEITYAGGGFGRKWGVDFVSVAIEAARGVPGRMVKTIWPREQDLAGDQYRPAYMARSRAAIGKDGSLTAIHSRIAGESIMAYHGRPPMGGMEGLADATAAGQLIYGDYADPVKRIEYHEVDLQVPVGFWRSVSMSQNAFFAESFIDEIARETGQSPLALRLALLKGHPRITPVLRKAAEMIALDAPRAKGIGRGIAFSYSGANFCAIGVEVEVKDSSLSLKRIACACDCGLMIDPVSVEGQLTGGIIFGLQASLWGEVHFEDGRPTAQNFSDYRLPMMQDVPPIEVVLMPGSEEPGNIGEASTPVIAPALVNAIADAGGPRIRTLPIARTLTI